MHRLWRWVLLAGLVSCVLGPITGCTRQFFRKRADVEVAQVLCEKDVFQQWKIQNMHVYPHPMARFADPSNPDRPPMPPDDPAAHLLAPSPQRPYRKSGTAWVEGTGYLSMLEAYDRENREYCAERDRKEAAERGEDPAVKRTAYAQEQLPEPREELTPAVPTPPVKEALNTGDDESEKGYLIRIDQAVELALVNSREFQTRREDLYLSALPVTRERFAFAAQAYAVGEAIRERTGAELPPGKGDRWRINNQAGVGALFSTGALLLLQFANQTVIELTNPTLPRTSSVSTIDLDIIQPLLRGGGRAVTLEPLTQAERNLLYDIRDYARFRKLFYQYMTAGGGVQVGSGFAGLVSGGQGPAAGLSFPGGASAVRPGSVGIQPQGLGGPATPTLGYLNTLLAGEQLKVQRQNVERLEYALELFKSFERGGRVSPLQVGDVKQELLSGQAQVLTRQLDFRDRLDGFKLQLGVPQNICLELDDCPIRKVAEQLDRYDQAIKDYEAIGDRIDRLLESGKRIELRKELQDILTQSALVKGTKTFKVNALKAWEQWRERYPTGKELRARLEVLDRRLGELLAEEAELALDEKQLAPEKAKELRALEGEFSYVRLENAVREYEAAPWEKAADAEARDRLYARLARDVRNALLFILVGASNERLDAIRPLWPSVPPVAAGGVNLMDGKLEEAYAVATKTALENRLDLMNARAEVHDAWRKIALFANSLLGTFNVAYHLDSSTPPDEAQPLAFQPSRTRHQLILNWELPLVRLSERNAYRAALIGYQRARRYLMESEDLVANQVRADVRQVRVLAENYKIQQEAVDVAFRRLESALETFRAPPDPNRPGSDSEAAALTTQLLRAYNQVVNSQLQLINIWTNYRINRQQLVIDLELMPLDARGVWIDEFTQDQCCGQPVQGAGSVCSFGAPVAVQAAPELVR